MFKVINKDTRPTTMSLLLTLNIFCTLCVSIVNFEHVIAWWEGTSILSGISSLSLNSSTCNKISHCIKLY